MRVDQIIRTECVENGCVTVDHGPVAPVLEGFDFVDRHFGGGHELFLGAVCTAGANLEIG
jgi:hypothetical protein